MTDLPNESFGNGKKPCCLRARTKKIRFPQIHVSTGSKHLVQGPFKAIHLERRQVYPKTFFPSVLYILEFFTTALTDNVTSTQDTQKPTGIIWVYPIREHFVRTIFSPVALQVTILKPNFCFTVGVLKHCCVAFSLHKNR